MQPSMNTTREYHLSQAKDPARVWDIIIIGGGSTGAGIALDAAARGYQVLLLEGHDFGKGTSSRSTKLIHGGVRYLQQMQFGMVRESLRERGRLLENAPHLVHELEFLIPCTKQFDRWFYGVGLKLYDFLAIGSKMVKSHQVSRAKLYQCMPGLAANKFVGAVAYSDAQFDDTRLLIEIVRASADRGATVLNYAPVVSLRKDNQGKTSGVVIRDTETNQTWEAKARCVINATGPFCDAIRTLDSPDVSRLVAASQGIHLVLPKSFFPTTRAMIVPKTSDGRVLFVIPWLDHVLVGTTDTPIEQASFEPQPFRQEIDFLLDTLEEYCGRRPKPEECLSVFTGIRPLVKANKQQATKKLSRDHTIEVSDSGLVTIAGGKWTTYRHMAEDCVNVIAERFGLKKIPSQTHSQTLCASQQYRTNLQTQSNTEQPLCVELAITKTDFVSAVRYEFARTVEDMLARRTRALFLNAAAAMKLAPMAAEVLSQELDRDEAWKQAQVADFRELALKYLPSQYL